MQSLQCKMDDNAADTEKPVAFGLVNQKRENGKLGMLKRVWCAKERARQKVSRYLPTSMIDL